MNVSPVRLSRWVQLAQLLAVERHVRVVEQRQDLVLDDLVVVTVRLEAAELEGHGRGRRDDGAVGGADPADVGA